MAFSRSELDFSLHTKPRDCQWRNSTEDIFDSFINVDVLHDQDSDNQRKYSNTFASSFGSYASSSGSDVLDVPVKSDLDPNAWRPSALLCEQKDLSPSRPDRYLSPYLTSNTGTTNSETDMLMLMLPTVEMDDERAFLAPDSSTPRGRAIARNSIDAPLSVWRRQPSGSPSKVEKSHRRVTTMRRVSPQKPSNSVTLVTKRFRDATTTSQFDVKLPLSKYRLATPPPSIQSQPESFEWDFSGDHAGHSPHPFGDEFEQSMSRVSSGYNRLQHQNGPEGALGIALQLASPSRAAEPQPDSVPTKASTPLDPHPESFSLTPPASQPQSQSPWSTHEDPFMQYPLNSPGVQGPDKAEWLTTAGPNGFTCGASAGSANDYPSAYGLGISCAGDSSSRGAGLEFSGYPTSAMHGQPSLMPHCSPAPRARLAARPQSGDFSASALSPGMEHAMYPLSPLFEQQYCLDYTLSPGRQQAVPAYSSSPVMMQERQPYRPTHHRSHTIGAPGSTVQASMLMQPAYAPGMSFHPPPSSPSPPPRHSRSRASSQRPRSKSAHQRRKSSTGVATNHSRQSGTANDRFVNFTANDSTKILTGVAPSGSSKTKARREREAAEKRRKLSEAAKRAVLEAGGDLEALEREVLAFAE